MVGCDSKIREVKTHRVGKVGSEACAGFTLECGLHATGNGAPWKAREPARLTRLRKGHLAACRPLLTRNLEQTKRVQQGPSRSSRVIHASLVRVRPLP